MNLQVNLPELTFRGILLGGILTIILTASNVYLGLKVGLTFSSSIPAAVISMAVLGMFKNSNILENNMVQTQVSAAGTLSAVIFVIPGLFMVGYWTNFPLWQTFMICLCGGILGILFTIPLRRAMVVESDLTYPEGRAAAEILKVRGAESKAGVKELSIGSVVAACMSFLTGGIKIASDSISIGFIWSKMAFAMSMAYSAALLGAGYLIGMAGSIGLFVGMFLAWFVLVPYFSSLEHLNLAKDAVDIASSIWVHKVRLIGTGTIAVAAIWTLIELSKSVFSGMLAVIHHAKNQNLHKSLDRTEQDLSFKTIAGYFIVTVIALFITFYSFMEDAHLSAGYTIGFSVIGVLLVVIIGFLVAAACGYMAGLVGSSSSPISGIGLIAIITSSLVILATGHSLFTNPILLKFATALAIFITSVILATAAISNDNLQDLKTGQLVGATPWRQQVALIIGCVFGAIAITPVLNLLYKAYGFVGALPRPGMDPNLALAAPQANLMSTLAQGIFKSNINWNYILVGIGIGILVIIIDLILRKSSKMSLPPLAVGIGIYLPASVNLPLVVGGVMGYFIKKYLAKRYAHQTNGEEKLKEHEQKGVLLASGFIVGESIVGVILAGITVLSVTKGGSENPLQMHLGFINPGIFSALLFIAIMILFVYRVVRKN